MAWFYILPAVAFLEIVALAAIGVSVVLYNKGMVGWSNKLRYVIYTLCLGLTTTMFPTIYGVSVFFDCNWSKGYLQRDPTMLCWNFTQSGTGEMAIRLFKNFFLEKICSTSCSGNHYYYSATCIICIFHDGLL